MRRRRRRRRRRRGQLDVKESLGSECDIIYCIS